MPHAFRSTLKTFQTRAGKTGRFYSLPALARQFPNVNRLPVSLRIVLEALLRHCDGQRVSERHVLELAEWRPRAPRTEEIPFVVARVVQVGRRSFAGGDDGVGVVGEFAPATDR